MATRVVTAHLPEELAKKLDGLAGRLERPRGWLVKEAIAAYVGIADERQRETLEALKDVDAGRVVEHVEVEAWAAGLGQPRKAPSRPAKSRVKRTG
jgi:predicted transcriptional regulator